MVKLKVENDPPIPEYGTPFNVTAEEGTPDYTFKWQIDDGVTDSKTQSDATLSLDFEQGDIGENIFIGVTDGGGGEVRLKDFGKILPGSNPIE